MRLALLALPILALSACTEDEAACFKRLAADFDQEATEARKIGDLDRAVIARTSAVEASDIYEDDDRSACDYVSAGEYLQRK